MSTRSSSKKKSTSSASKKTQRSGSYSATTPRSGSYKGKSGSYKTAKPRTGARKSSSQARTRKRKQNAVDQPFDPAVLRKAKKIAAAYTLRFEPADGGYVGNPIEMPSVIGFGKTIEASAEETIELIVSALATLIEMREPVPSPASAAKRDRQVNIRLTADEKERLEEAARQAGFRSLSDFLRNAGLDRAG